MTGILATPGPTPLPPEVRKALSESIIHHRSPEYKELFQEIREGLRFIFQTKDEVLLLSSSGTGAMEAAISNLTTPGELVIFIDRPETIR